MVSELSIYYLEGETKKLLVSIVVLLLVSCSALSPEATITPSLIMTKTNEVMPSYPSNQTEPPTSGSLFPREWITLAVSSVLAIVNLCYTRSIDKKRLAFERKQGELNSLQIDIERKASFAVSSRHSSPNSSSHKVIITNIGKSEARNICLFIQPSDNILILDDLSTLFPFERLAPGEEISLLVILRYSQPKKYRFDITWSDDYNKENSCPLFLSW